MVLTRLVLGPEVVLSMAAHIVQGPDETMCLIVLIVTGCLLFQIILE